jgi:hypothetical protein
VLTNAKVNVEQRPAIKFCVRNRISNKKPFETVSKAYVEAGEKKAMRTLVI